MNNKDLYLFNTVKSVQFLKSFRPSSTPFNDKVSPGLSNINIHSYLTRSHFNNPPLVYKKETKEEHIPSKFVQEGKGIEDVLFKPIKIKHTLLEASSSEPVDIEEKKTDVDDEVKQKIVNVTEEPKKRKKEKTSSPIKKKKSKLMFNILN